MDTHPKCGLYVETNGATHAPREYEKSYCSYNGVFWGRTGHVPKQVQNCHEKAGKRDWLRLLLWLGGRAGVRVSICMVQSLCDLNVLLVPNQRASGAFLSAYLEAGKKWKWGEVEIGEATSSCR